MGIAYILGLESKIPNDRHQTVAFLKYLVLKFLLEYSYFAFIM